MNYYFLHYKITMDKRHPFQTNYRHHNPSYMKCISGQSTKKFVISLLREALVWNTQKQNLLLALTGKREKYFTNYTGNFIGHWYVLP